MMTLLPQITVGPITGIGSQLANPGANSGTLLGNILTGAVGIMTAIGIIWFLFNIITGGIDIIGAGGDAQKVASARQKIVNGIVGIIILVSAIALVGLIAWILRIQDPLNINVWIQQIGI